MNAQEAADTLEMVKFLATHVPEADLDVILTYAKEVRPPGIQSYTEHLAAICGAVARDKRSIGVILEYVRQPKEQREVQQVLMAWAVETLRPLQGIAPDRARLAELQQRAKEKLHELFPRASEPKLNGAILLGIKLSETGYAFEVGTMVRCMFHPDTYERTT